MAQQETGTTAKAERGGTGWNEHTVAWEGSTDA